MCISSLVRYLLNSLGHFFEFSYCWVLSSLYILGNCTVLDVSFASTFLQSVACLLIYLIVIFFLPTLLRYNWHITLCNFKVYTWASLVAQMIKNLPALKGPGFDPWVGKISWRREWIPTPVFLPGESHGQRSLVDCSSWGCKESDVTEWLTHTQPTRRTHVNLIPLYTTLWSLPECYLTTPSYHINITSFFVVRTLKIQFLSNSKFYWTILSSLITMLYIKIYFSLEVYILWPSSPNFFHPSPF